MLTIYFIAAFWFLSALVSTIIANKFFLPDHLLEKPVLDVTLKLEAGAGENVSRNSTNS